MSDEKVLTKEIAEQFLEDEYGVDVSEFTAIEDDAALMLVKHEGGELNLTGLTSLSSATAEILSQWNGELILDGIEQLPDALAESLGKHQGNLLLNRLTSLPDTAAEILSNHQGQLWLDGLSELSDAAAESLSKHRGDLYLNGVTSLSDAAASSLSKHGFELHLTGLENIADETAQVFNSATAKLYLPDANSLAWLITEGHAVSDLAFTAALKQTAIDNFTGVVSMVENILCSTHNDSYGRLLSDSINRFEIQMELAQNCGRITVGIAEKIINIEGDWENDLLKEESECIDEDADLHSERDFLANAISIDDEAAEILSNREGELSLGNLVTLSDVAARFLSECEGRISLNLNNLPESAAAILRKHPSFADED